CGIGRAPREEHGAVLLGDPCRDDFRVQVEHEAAARAHFLLAMVGRYGLDREGGAAERAEAHRGRGQDAVLAHSSESKPAILGATMPDDRRGPVVIGLLTPVSRPGLFLASRRVVPPPHPPL